MKSKDPERFSEETCPVFEKDIRIKQAEVLRNSSLSDYEKFLNFPVFSNRQTITRFLARYELFQKTLNITGSIFECGVLFGGGLFSFAHFSSIFEPVNAQRKIVGFDTFMEYNISLISE